MEKYCDLHTHSRYSDGTFTPEQLLRAAEVENLCAVALCDHNTVAGLPDFMAAAGHSPVEAVAGIEFSTEYRGTELHILALFLPRQHWAEVSALMEDYSRRKEESNLALIRALAGAGYPLDYEAIKAGTPKGHINRAHIAAALTEQGYTPSIQAAFSELLSPKHGLYCPPRRPDAFETVSMIRSMGAISVLAHPFLNLKTEASLREFLVQAKERGLDAMETLYPLYDSGTTRLSIRLTEEFDLLQSGGSDFHGANKPDIRLGRGRGELAVPGLIYDKMKKLLQTR